MVQTDILFSLLLQETGRLHASDLLASPRVATTRKRHWAEDGLKL